MIKIVEFNDYRSFIEEFSQKSKMPYRRLAELARIHSSYFSRVMVGKASFSQEQAFHLSKIMKLTEWRLDYFLLLVELDSSGDVGHKEHLLKKIQKIKDKHDKIANRLENVRNQKELSSEDRALYYQKAMTARIHMYLTIKKYRENIDLIAKAMRIELFQVEENIDLLERLKIISRDKKGIQVLQWAVHLEEGDPLLINHHINWRLETIQNLRYYTKSNGGHHVSAVFSTNKEGLEKIKSLFKKFIVDVQNEASKVKADEEVFALNFDLF